MPSEPDNNGQGPPDEDDHVSLTFRRSNPSFTSVDVDALLKQATQSTSAVVGSVAVQEPDSHQQQPNRMTVAVWANSKSRRRIAMLTKMSVLGVCAVGLCAALVFSLLGSGAVLAQVQSALKKTQTATYTVTTSVGDQPAQIWKVKLRGENLCRAEQANGSYVVFDVKAKKIMEVNPAESKVRITTNLQVPADFNILAKLTNLKDSAAKIQTVVPNRKVGGIVGTGFVIEENGVEYNVWVDPQTNLPLELEAMRKVPLPSGQGDVKEQIIVEHWTDFHFDEQLDEALFAFETPEGFAVEIRQAPAEGGTVQDEQRRAAEQQKAAEEAAKKNAK